MEIDIRHCRVDEIDTEHAVTLVLSGGALVRIESRFDLALPTASPTTIDPENLSADLGLRQVLGGRLVEQATAAEETGLLVITFLGGLVLTVPPDPDFEAWSMSWSNGSMVVALPGGGLSSWGARA